MNIPGIIPAAPGSGAPPPPREQSPTKDQSDGFSNAMDDAGKEGADTTGPDTSPAADNGPGDNGPGDNRTGDEDRNAEGRSEQSASADEETKTSGPAEPGTSPEETVDTPSVATSPAPRAADAIDEAQAPRTTTQSERPALTSPPASTDPMADGPADAQQQAPVDVDAQTSAVQTSSAGGGTGASTATSESPRTAQALRDTGEAKAPGTTPQSPTIADTTSAAAASTDATAGTDLPPEADLPRRRQLTTPAPQAPQADDGPIPAPTRTGDFPIQQIAAPGPAARVPGSTSGEVQTRAVDTAASPNHPGTPASASTPATTAATAASDFATLAQRAASAGDRQLVDQVLVGLRDIRNGQTVEIHLDPPELGRVDITLDVTETGVRATLSAERTVTEDIIRRHAELLAQHLRDAGFENIDLSFADFHKGTCGEDTPLQALLDASDDASDDTPQIAQFARMRPAGTSGLDIKL